MSHRTHDTRAIVTGAGSGIGRAFALELARRGGRVVCSDLDIDSATETVREIVGAGGAAHPLRTDVTDVRAIEQLATDGERWLGGPATLVVNNAGIGTGGCPVGETSLADWKATLDVNLWGVIYGCHVFAPRLRALGRGGIINVASAASFAAAPQMAAYNVSKAGVLALSETLAAELVGTDIAVTVLCPTFVKTNILNTTRTTGDGQRMGQWMMKWTGANADHIVRTTLDAHDHRRLHVVPQLDAKLIWRLKRLAPAGYTRAIGALHRLGSRKQRASE